jgi:hypothetical protein
MAHLDTAQAAAVEAAMVTDEVEKTVVYGFDSGAVAVAAAATAVITVAPQRRHIPERLVVGAAVAANFVIADIRIGVDPVLATTGLISAASFLPDSTVNAFKSVVCEVGTDVTVSVTNISAAGARFIGNIHGRPV